MKLLVPAIKICFAATIQILLQVGLWIAAVGYARSHDRFPPTFFEFTFTLGLLGFGIVALICSIFAYTTVQRRQSMVVVFGCLTGWVLTLLSSLNERPVAVPVFIAIGAGILFTFNGLILPTLTWFRTKQAEQAGSDDAYKRPC